MEHFFSVIITTYNREKIITRALNSLLNQDFDDWEAIIVDDGSLDDTFEVIKPIVMNHEKIKYIFQKNQGLPSARNSGIQLSTGKYITFLDSDDEYKKNHLSSRFDILHQNIHVDLLHGGVEIIGEPYVPDKMNPANMIHLYDCVIGGTFFIKRDIFKNIGYFKNINYADDNEFFERASSSGMKILKTNINTYIYLRDSSDSICNNLNRTHKIKL